MTVRGVDVGAGGGGAVLGGVDRRAASALDALAGSGRAHRGVATA